MINETQLTIELAHAFGSDPGPILQAAAERDVPLSDVIMAYVRTLRYLRLHGLEATGNAAVTEWDARPPGVFDARVVLQDEFWCDIFRRPFRVQEMPRQYAENVITYLHDHIHDIVDVVDGGGDPHDWLDSQPLVRSLRSQVDRATPPELS
ncbi:hypothetical protein [Leifsonia sp. C5G2]|uniref:hypothetical protein n=1 Tax=Leifsonia sp. C5G2 TaxID=2735269 RepID=UPI0015859718|nr:hypothetical protein [Leifsonia sp. C5G2]NUU06180.1 hypothetical protein [Leifsonia sp. C5G2]